MNYLINLLDRHRWLPPLLATACILLLGYMDMHP